MNAKRFKQVWHGLLAVALILIGTGTLGAQAIFPGKVAKPYKAVDMGNVVSVGRISNNAEWFWRENPWNLSRIKSGVVVVGTKLSDSGGRLHTAGFICRVVPAELVCAEGELLHDATNGVVGSAIGLTGDGQYAVGYAGVNATIWNNWNYPMERLAYPPIFGSTLRTLAECTNRPTVANAINMPTSPDWKTVNDYWSAAGYCISSDRGERIPVRWAASKEDSLDAFRLPTHHEPLSTWNRNPKPLPGSAFDVNDAAEFVGEENGQAAWWPKGADLPVLLGKNLQEATGISNTGFITGTGIFEVWAPPLTAFYPFQARGFIRTPEGKIVQTLLPSKDYTLDLRSGANKINDAGIAAGYMMRGRDDTTMRAMIWNSTGAFADLNDATAGLPPNTVLTNAIDINENGDISAIGVIGGQLRGFVLIRQADVIFNPFGN